ncbi:MAG: argininosuccinate lyase [Myxococcaceae bacterium]
MTVARTQATGKKELDPEILDFTTSLPVDQALYAADIAGSLAHAQMLGESGIIPEADAKHIRQGLGSIFKDAVEGRLTWPHEEDIHMSIEGELLKRVGDPARRLHTGRSRNDQIATDARLHLREAAVKILRELALTLEAIVERARGTEGAWLMPAYTHRQRAQPVTVAYLLSAYGQMLARDAAQFSQVLNALDESPLGVGAVSGTSLPIRRERSAELLGFSRLTANGLDTVGDRDFALDFIYACTRCLTHLSRISQDFVDFASREYSFLELDDSISFGSSMMPQKKNPDLFELIRGKSTRSLGALTMLFATVKGLPVGYMRDLQEDKGPYLEAATLTPKCLSAFRKGLAGVRFREQPLMNALAGGETLATDLAERLVSNGLAFREAYQAVGALVRVASAANKGLDALTPADLQAAGSKVTPEDLAVLSPARAAAAKEAPGGTGPTSVANQLEQLSEAVRGAKARAASVPALADLIARLA